MIFYSAKRTRFRDYDDYVDRCFDGGAVGERCGLQ